MSTSSKELSSNSQYQESSVNHFLRKCSIFDKKFGKKLIDSVVEVVEGFEDDSNVNSFNKNEVEDKPNQLKKNGLKFVFLF